ncbi:MAG: adenylate/guanylate cyclase domain-containing protein [Chloroflexia bacterium]
MGKAPHEQEQVNEAWRAFMMGEVPAFHRTRRVFKMLPSSPRCKVCYSPFHGPGGFVMKVIGRSPAKMNPNLCGTCEKFARERPGGAEIPLSLLFGDIRGSTGLAERLGTAQFSALIARFYDAVTDELIKEDALIDRLVGDEVVALFVPVLAGSDHAKAALRGAQGLLRATGHEDAGGPWVPVGIGLHTGRAFVGAVGSAGVSDITALGDDVNLTARLASIAQAGEILMTEGARAALELATDGLEPRKLELKGRSAPVDAWLMCVGAEVAASNK